MALATVAAPDRTPVSVGAPAGAERTNPLARGALAVAGAFALLELALSARYGFHRDELYFMACARHLAWGYVDQPPLVPAVAWLAMHVVGTSPTALRVLPALAGAGAVVLTALMARELGGSRQAQVLAAAAAATSPQLLATFHLLSTAAFDDLFWAGITYLILKLLRNGDPRLWIPIGALAGVALMNKLNVAFLLAALALGMLLGGQRRLLIHRWTALGATIGLLIWLPDIVWNASHGWAALRMLSSLHQENSGLGASLSFLPSQLVVVGPVLVVLWVAGLRRLMRLPTYRPLAITYLVLATVFTATGGKSYYLAGMYFVLFAAGGVAVEERLASSGRRQRALKRWAAVMLVGLAAALPLSLPVLPESTLPAGSWEGQINKDLSATIGWKLLVNQLATIRDRLPAVQRADVVVFSGDYGAAGAVDLYGPSLGLPAAISGHNNYWWWGPRSARNGATTIAVNLPRSYLLTIFSSVTPAGTVATPDGSWSEERGDPIWICTGQKVSWAQAWAAARHYG